MAPNSQTLRFKRAVGVSPAEVYRAFTHPTALRDWFCHAAQSDPRQGGRLYVWWDSGYHATGEFTRLEPGQKIGFTWQGRGEPQTTRVLITLAAKNGGTAVTVVHAGVGTDRSWAGTIQEINRGWEIGLENLQSVLETGIDLRIARLPRLGIIVGDFGAEMAAKLGMPVTAGIRLEGTFEGTGARAAGLQKDDVVVKMGRRKVTDFPSVSRALQEYRAGDTMQVVFYRGAEKMTAALELSSRPSPDLPTTAAELANIARQNYERVQTQIAELVQGLSETQAEHRPAPNEWNIKELIAHFIACERDLQSWMADMLNDNTAGDSLAFRPNVTVRLAALVARYPTVPALLEALQASAVETVGLLAALPPEFVARKHLYGRVAGWVTQVVPGHLPEEHADQFKATIEAARRSGA